MTYRLPFERKDRVADLGVIVVEEGLGGGIGGGNVRVGENGDVLVDDGLGVALSETASLPVSPSFWQCRSGRRSDERQGSEEMQELHLSGKAEKKESERCVQTGDWKHLTSSMQEQEETLRDCRPTVDLLCLLRAQQVATRTPGDLRDASLLLMAGRKSMQGTCNLDVDRADEVPQVAAWIGLDCEQPSSRFKAKTS